MNDQTKINTNGRAQIFALLRDTVTEQPQPRRPNYLDDATANVMISRAMSSFEAPVCPMDVVAPKQQAKPKPNRSTGRVAPRILHNTGALNQSATS